MRFYFILLCFFFLSSFNEKFSDDFNKIEYPDFLYEYKWADSVMSNMTLSEKICQLFFVSADLDSSYLYNLIDSFHIGGVTFFKGSIEDQAYRTNLYQKKSKIPLLVSIDAEWGLNMRISECEKFPWPMTLGAIRDDSLIFNYSKIIAKNLKRMGVHINFAPVLDINSNPKNPIIYNRSFGESYFNVSRKSLAYFKGHNELNIFCTAKHFPGHGDTDKDSHKTLPKVNRDYSLLDSVDLYPYKTLIAKGLGGVMVAHLDVPSLDSSGLPSTLSYPIIEDLLKKRLNFKGLVVTDGLNMKAVSDSFPSGSLEVMSLLSGNDILLLPQDVPVALSKILQSIKDSVLTELMIDEKCRKVLMLKKWVGLDKIKSVDTLSLINDIVNEETDLMNRYLIESSLTLLKNEKDLIPLRSIDTLDVLNLSFSSSNESNIFGNTILKYHKIDFIQCFNKDDLDDVINNDIEKYNLVIVSIHEDSSSPWNKHSFDNYLNDFISQIPENIKVISVHFANPYSLNGFHSHVNVESILMSYQNDSLFQSYSAQLIFGGIPSKGRLPVSTNYFPINTGLETNKTRLKYTVPLELGVYEKDLIKIDSIVEDAIEMKAMPGCQVALSKEGKVFYQKSFGYNIFKDSEVYKLNNKKQKILRQKVSNDDIYDLASLTKIVVSTPLIMKMFEFNYINLDSTLSHYIKDLDTTNKSNIKIRNILSHNAGLKSWIPFYKKTIKNRRLMSKYYSSKKLDDFSIKVAGDIFLKNSFKDTIYKDIIQSELDSNPVYRYSDLGYYLLQNIIEDKMGSSLDTLISDHFLKKLGMYSTMYNPISNNLYSFKKIMPSEKDKYFRKQLLIGYVHDMGAAMFGGVAGHAGLFSNSNDLLKISELYLNQGSYGGDYYFNDTVFSVFNQYHFKNEGNRRGLGFDKPSLKDNQTSSCSNYASSNSFGHSGFTGTLMWIDPKYKLNYIFLSNRTYPTYRNKKLIEMNVRTKIHDEVYNVFLKNNIL